MQPARDEKKIEQVSDGSGKLTSVFDAMILEKI
jgi:hypothetical protein